ncbi:MAG: 50S ribosomal protein L17 [Bdellovibrionota bacterium]
MSSHRRSTQNFGRAFGPRRALVRGLVTSLVEHGRIKTTVEKAKEVKRHVEKAITVGKRGGVSAHRVLLSKYPNKDTVSTIVTDLSVRFKDRPGGYCRVIKLGPRPGDNAEMAYVEFVDFDYSQFLKTGSKKAEGKKGDTADKAKADKEKTDKKASKVRTLKAAAARKSRRKMQNKSRAESRANNR